MDGNGRTVAPSVRVTAKEDQPRWDKLPAEIAELQKQVDDLTSAAKQKLPELRKELAASDAAEKGERGKASAAPAAHRRLGQEHRQRRRDELCPDRHAQVGGRAAGQSAAAGRRDLRRPGEPGRLRHRRCLLLRLLASRYRRPNGCSPRPHGPGRQSPRVGPVPAGRPPRPPLHHTPGRSTR